MHFAFIVNEKQMMYEVFCETTAHIRQRPRGCSGHPRAQCERFLARSVSHIENVAMSSFRLPSTKSHLSYRVFVLDAVVAVFAPLTALLLRNPLLFNDPNLPLIATYTCASFLFCSASFILFRIANSLPRFVSFQDAIQIFKAALTGVAATNIFMFSLTRLDEVPRSVPALQLLLLVGGLNVTRMLRRAFIQRRDMASCTTPGHAEEENTIVIGANKLAWFYLRMLDNFGAGNRRIVGLLDDDSYLYGRSIAGHVVLGSPDEAEALFHDFAMHGTPITKAVVCERNPQRAHALAARLETVCAAENIELEFLANQLGILEPSLDTGAIGLDTVVTGRQLNSYFKVKRIIDVAVSGTAIFIFVPIYVTVAILILAESGLPVLFWQRRVGRGGQSMYVYKFRTMRKPVDRDGRYLSQTERRSPIGSFLRATRLDELPQLFNVLGGSMSLIGPRPLLPIDQPTSETSRLLITPGITGWAQVHGGNLISPEEKRLLDEYYVEHASLGLDALIFWRTIKTVLLGDAKVQATLPKASERSRRSAS